MLQLRKATKSIGRKVTAWAEGLRRISEKYEHDMHPKSRSMRRNNAQCY